MTPTFKSFEQIMLLLTMIGTMLTAVATVGLVIGAVMAWRVARENLEHLRADSRARTRPYVYARLVPSLGGSNAWDLIIENSDRSSATELTVDPTTMGMTPRGRAGVTLDHRATPMEKNLREIVESLNELRRGE